MAKICGTCGYCSPKEEKGDRLSKDGYCYANPPKPGDMRPKVKMGAQACRHYKDRKNG